MNIPVYKSSNPELTRIFLLFVFFISIFFAIYGTISFIKNIHAINNTELVPVIFWYLGAIITLTFYVLSKRYLGYILFYDELIEVYQNGKHFKAYWSELKEFKYPYNPSDFTLYSLSYKDQRDRTFFMPRGITISFMNSIYKYPPVVNFINSKLLEK